jgi:hypothetical protein
VSEARAADRHQAILPTSARLSYIHIMYVPSSWLSVFHSIYLFECCMIIYVLIQMGRVVQIDQSIKQAKADRRKQDEWAGPGRDF